MTGGLLPGQVADYWQGMTDDAWAYFSHRENFGKYQLGVPTDIDSQQFHRKHVATQQLPSGYDLGGKHPKHLGNRAVDPSPSGRVAEQRRGFVIYLERFA